LLRYWEENEDILTTGSEVNGLKRRMEMLSGAQKHVNCIDQGIKCFCEIFLTWDGQPFVFSEFMSWFDGWY